MFTIHKEELEVNGKKLTLETGKVARQADGAILASLGETVVIATVVGNGDALYHPTLLTVVLASQLLFSRDNGLRHAAYAGCAIRETRLHGANEGGP